MKFFSFLSSSSTQNLNTLVAQWQQSRNTGKDIDRKTLRKYYKQLRSFASNSENADLVIQGLQALIILENRRAMRRSNGQNFGVFGIWTRDIFIAQSVCSLSLESDIKSYISNRSPNLETLDQLKDIFEKKINAHLRQEEKRPYFRESEYMSENFELILEVLSHLAEQCGQMTANDACSIRFPI